MREASSHPRKEMCRTQAKALPRRLDLLRFQYSQTLVVFFSSSNFSCYFSFSLVFSLFLNALQLFSTSFYFLLFQTISCIFFISNSGCLASLQEDALYFFVFLFSSSQLANSISSFCSSCVSFSLPSFAALFRHHSLGRLVAWAFVLQLGRGERG